MMGRFWKSNRFRFPDYRAAETTKPVTFSSQVNAGSSLMWLRTRISFRLVPVCRLIGGDREDVESVRVEL